MLNHGTITKCAFTDQHTCHQRRKCGFRNSEEPLVSFTHSQECIYDCPSGFRSLSCEMDMLCSFWPVYGSPRSEHKNFALSNASLPPKDSKVKRRQECAHMMGGQRRAETPHSPDNPNPSVLQYQLRDERSVIRHCVLCTYRGKSSSYSLQPKAILLRNPYSPLPRFCKTHPP